MQTRLLVCVIASTILLTEPFSFASPLDNSKIVNGVLVNPGEFPYVVTLQVNDRHICNGFIYNELWVVTAASCVEQITVFRDLMVNVADLNFLDDEEIDQEAYSVIDIKMAPEFDELNGQDNLALVKLTRPITFGPNVNCVKIGEVELTGSIKGIIIGYGSLQSAGLPSNRCRKGEVTLCSTCNPWPIYSESFMICAGTSNDVTKPCDFDFGSPLIQDDFVVGILSQQINCQASPYESSIYIRLASYYSWIRQVANTQPSTCSRPNTTSSTLSTTARPIATLYKQL